MWGGSCKLWSSCFDGIPTRGRAVSTVSFVRHLGFEGEKSIPVLGFSTLMGGDTWTEACGNKLLGQ